jgi:hypothetical protein
VSGESEVVSGHNLQRVLVLQMFEQSEAMYGHNFQRVSIFFRCPDNQKQCPDMTSREINFSSCVRKAKSHVWTQLAKKFVVVLVFGQ